MKMIAKLGIGAVFAGLSLGAASPAFADTCTGSCGTLGADGVVSSPPAYGPTYQYVSTAGGVTGAGQIAGVGGTNGSELTTTAFTANGGDKLNFYFNYVTSDGGGTYSDYAFAELLNGGLHSAYLFTARTEPTGDTSPGQGLPSNDSSLTPGSSAIIGGAPAWSPLGNSSGACFSSGCGYTGWIQSSYTLGSAGLYSIRYGVTNIGDTSFDSGLAFAGITVNNAPVIPAGAVPEPATWAMMILGMSAVGFAMRRKMRESNAKFDAHIKAVTYGAAA